MSNLMHFLSRLFSTTAISFEKGRCVAVKGKLPGSLLRDLADCLEEAGIARGEIWLAGNGRVSFSREIPGEIHQRLRNTLAQM
jgi:hypothetical protein